MNENPLTPLGPETIRPTAPAQTPAQAPQRSANSPSFEVLLERLQTKAQELDERSQTVNDPENLSGAVEAARASLDDAVSLGDRLLEAYREARQQSDNGTDTTNNQEN